MAVPDAPDFWSNVLPGGVGTALGVLGTIIVAVLNRQPSMATIVDARIRTLIEGYEKHVDDLQREIRKLEAKVDTLTRALAAAHAYRFPGKIDDI
ncbi:hypothetical protein Msil_3067 [Methylocella silvestris BL2]|uniref:Uncharacterized protein n=1 Tax=Methylocella silvestris (strain DSM 15510 / CIP 108128 / LMG 27833 / NCIMB 13906 / BL2) TaxID=395965 RepID=B8EKU9_METSB|nr:hypothetical protein [Methylocella silvestris]ACK51977.1 hypothetical protein Msil_3067 [Methylocella silvestris BL2]